MDFVKKLIDNGSLEKEEYVKLLEACVCPQTGAAIREELAGVSISDSGKSVSKKEEIPSQMLDFLSGLEDAF